jgi:asparagine synthase (glutamine-hydrolysing)
MCGINGIWGMEDRGKAAHLIAGMNNRLAHRGPDDEGFFSDEYVNLGHRRLSIIDLSKAGHQPMFSSDKRYAIVYNGELYNYRDLRFELQRIVVGSAQSAYPFSTQTDTEVILAAFIRWGKDCVSHFNGMFSFAIWDCQEKKLFIARDRLGIKPLYYYYKDKLFLFSSEIRPLLGTGLIPRKVDKDSLADFLRYQTVHAPKTIIQGIGMLLPGHSAIISEAGIEVHQYWKMSEFVSRKPSDTTYKQVCGDVQELLLQAVERRLIADVPFGAFLSGGIDSGAIVGLMARVSSGKIKTFNVSFDEGEFSEAPYAKRIADKFQTEHHEIRLSIGDFLSDLPEALAAMDHPSGDGPNTYVVSKATKAAGITMALSGLGGDELFAGYDIFKRSLSLNQKQWIASIPRFIRSGAGSLIQWKKPGSASDKITDILRSDSFDLASVYPFSRQVIREKTVSGLMNSVPLPPNAVKEMLSHYPTAKAGKYLSYISLAEINTYMQNVLLRDTDQMSMAVALEVRVPFLDHTLVEYVLGLSDKVKYPHSPKKLLVDSLGDLLPSEIVNRKKMGFTLPWKHWMKHELKDFCAEKLEALSKRESFQQEGVAKLWSDFLSDDPRVSWSRIWYLVVLENWLINNDVEA